jgi:hypothetical protein
MTKSQRIDLLNGKVSSLEADKRVLSTENTNLKVLVEILRRKTKEQEKTILKLELRMAQMEAKMIEKNIDDSST